MFKNLVLLLFKCINIKDADSFDIFPGCDGSCAECTEAGADKCLECKTGFDKVEDKCVGKWTGLF